MVRAHIHALAAALVGEKPAATPRQMHSNHPLVRKAQGPTPPRCHTIALGARFSVFAELPIKRYSQWVVTPAGCFTS